MKLFKSLLYIVFYLLLVFAIFYTKAWINISRAGYILLSAIMPFIPYLISKIIKLKFSETIIIAYDIFVLVAMILGNIFGFYRYLGFDKLLHTTSGLLISLVAFNLFCLLKDKVELKDKKDLSLALLFTSGTNMLVAFLWECFEFSLLVFFNNDAIHHYDQGVYDTMTDMIVCFIGGLVILYLIYRYYKTKKENFLIKSSKEFIKNNQIKTKV